MNKTLLNIASLFNLGPKSEAPAKQTNSVVNIAPKSISRVRKDIKDWNNALQLAMIADEPKNWMLYNLLDEVMQDALLRSQIENRRNKSLSQSFTIFGKDGKPNEEITDLFQNQIFVNDINRAVLDTVYLKHSLGEFVYQEDRLAFNLIPRQNVDPLNGFIYPDYTEDKKLKYRELKEYGIWIHEFGSTHLSADFGLVNAVVPHVLFKRFAQSCWSELCEIYGIPPRVMKTNTQDRRMLSRAEAMMRDMGAAAWFIIDETASFEWAQAVNTNGDVYKNLIHLCNSEISMPISGAIIGQDTVNGNRSKDESAQNMLDDLVQADLSLIEQAWNSQILKALQLIGFIPVGEYRFEYDKADDLGELWTRTRDLFSNGYEVDETWITDKFGVPIKSPRPPKGEEQFGADFFA